MAVDQQVQQANINQLVRDRARLKLMLVEAQMHQQANGGDVLAQTKPASLVAQIKGIEAGLHDLGVTPEGADRLASRLLGIADSSVTPSSPAATPATSGLPTGSPSTPATNGGVNMTQENKKTSGVPLWLALVLGGLLIFVLSIFVFKTIDDMNETGSTQPLATMAPENPTATPAAAPTSTPKADPTVTPAPTAEPASDDQTGGLPLGTESEGCLDGLPVTPDHTPSGEWTIPCDGMYRAINYWNQDVPEYNRGALQTNALLVCYDQHVVLHGRPGGSQYQWTHYKTALGNFQRSVGPNNPEVKLSDLVAQGLATVTVTGGGESVCDNPIGNVGNGGSSTPPSDPNDNPPAGDNGQPAIQDGCTTTNKQGTFSEFYGLGKDGYKPINEVQRIEVAGFSGWSEMDYYTLERDNSDNGAHRVPTINYVFPPREAMGGLVPIWFGNGSAWNYGMDNTQCNKDFALEWAKYYASQGAIEPGRLDNGNSGVVVDMQSCVLYNTRSDLGWNHQNVQQLLDAHRASMTTNPCPKVVDSQDSSVFYDLTPQAHDDRDTDGSLPSGPNADQQCSVIDSVNTGGLRSRWTIKTTADQVAVVNYWNNKANPNPNYKFLLKPSSSITLVGGGDATFFPASCAESDVVRDGLHALDKAKGQKLVNVRDIPSKYRR